MFHLQHFFIGIAGSRESACIKLCSWWSRFGWTDGCKWDVNVSLITSNFSLKNPVLFTHFWWCLPNFHVIFISLRIVSFTCVRYIQDPELEKLHADRIAALKVCTKALKWAWSWFFQIKFSLKFLIERSREATRIENARSWRVPGDNRSRLFGWSYC